MLNIEHKELDSKNYRKILDTWKRILLQKIVSMAVFHSLVMLPYLSTGGVMYTGMSVQRLCMHVYSNWLCQSQVQLAVSVQLSCKCNWLWPFLYCTMVELLCRRKCVVLAGSSVIMYWISSTWWTGVTMCGVACFPTSVWETELYRSDCLHHAWTQFGCQHCKCGSTYTHVSCILTHGHSRFLRRSN